MKLKDNYKTLLEKEELSIQNLRFQLTRIEDQLRYHEDKARHYKEQLERFKGGEQGD